MTNGPCSKDRAKSSCCCTSDKLLFVSCMKLIILLVMAIYAGNGMAEIFFEERNPVSGRYAILEDNGTSAWLYLTPQSGKGIEKDAFVYSPIEPREVLNKSEIENGKSPILTKNMSSASAVIENATRDQLSLVWSENGESVAVLYEGSPVAMIVEGERTGFSKSLSKDSFFGKPWEQGIYDRYFTHPVKR